MSTEWSVAPVQPGDVIGGKFKVEQVLGSGGVGVVVAARHLQLDERVALKFLLSNAIRSEVDVARFCREAQAAVRLRSEHVARVTDVGTLDSGSPYMVMEYLVGTDLSEVLAERGQLPPALAVDFVLQACEAIAEAHSVGFIHRDIKPSNLFLTHRSDGSALIKVLDFGIAKATHQAGLGEGEPELTRTKTMLGSPMYMSPEQVRNSKEVDERSDIWSIGVVLYELLTGCVPYDADSVTGVVAAVIGDPVPPIQHRRPDVAEGLATVVETCLKKNPEERYQSVAELAYALAPHADATSRLSVDRIAGTLGAKARFRALAGARRPGSEPLVAATTVKSSETRRTRHGPVLMGAGAAVLLAGVAVASTIAIMRTAGPDHTVPAARDDGADHAAPSADLPRPPPPLVLPADSPDAGHPLAEGTASASATPAVVGGEPAPSASPAATARAAPRGTGWAPRARVSTAAPAEIESRPSRSPQAKPSPGSAVIDTTVDTRR